MKMGMVKCVCGNVYEIRLDGDGICEFCQQDMNQFMEGGSFVVRPGVDDGQTSAQVNLAIQSLVSSPDLVKSVFFYNDEGEDDFTIWYNAESNKLICECWRSGSPMHPEMFLPHCGLDYTGITKEEENLYPPEFYIKWVVHLVE